MIAYDNVIVTDFDGCCAYWEHSFHMNMVLKGYAATQIGFYNIEDKYNTTKEEGVRLVESFNESAALRRLPPIRDSIKYIRKLHEDYGYVFHCISAIPNTRDIYEARLENIENLYGKTAFERLTLCGHSANKKALLSEYKDTGCLWIEDLSANLKYGVDVGMRGVLINHHYNKDDVNDFEHVRVNKWREIYQMVTGENG